MRSRAVRRLPIALIILIGLSVLVLAQANLTLKDVLEKNIQASGGKDKLAQVKNFSFKTGQTRTIVAASGEMKLSTGKEPVITEVILVQGGKVRRNSLDGITELSGIRKATNEVLVRLYAGLFTLINFQGALDFQGLKAYGPEKFYLLSTKIDPLQANFFLRQDDFRLKRLVLQGQTPEGDKVEVNYDFAPFEEVEGVSIPLSWFSAQVGARGMLTEAAEPKLNQPLDKGFFTKLDINAGSTEAKPGSLKGNILDLGGSPQGQGFTLTTNWIKADIDKAGWKTGDALILKTEGDAPGFSAGVVFYAAPNEIPARGEWPKDSGVLSPAPRGGATYIIQFSGMDASSAGAHLKILVPIRITTK